MLISLSPLSPSPISFFSFCSALSLSFFLLISLYLSIPLAGVVPVGNVTSSDILNSPVRRMVDDLDRTVVASENGSEGLPTSVQVCVCVCVIPTLFSLPQSFSFSYYAFLFSLSLFVSFFRFISLSLALTGGCSSMERRHLPVCDENHRKICKGRGGERGGRAGRY